MLPLSQHVKANSQLDRNCAADLKPENYTSIYHSVIPIPCNQTLAGYS